MLKGRFNFSGFVVSDWGACHSGAAALNAGLDIEMPGARYFNQGHFQAALDAGNISMAQIDETCERILRGWFALPSDKRTPCDGGVCITKNVSTAAHKALARKVAAYSTVLLKNAAVSPTGAKGADGGGGGGGGGGGSAPLLPLRKGAPLKIALIGADAEAPYTAGGGSGHVADSNVAVSPLAAFEARGVDVTCAPHPAPTPSAVPPPDRSREVRCWPGPL